MGRWTPQPAQPTSPYGAASSNLQQNSVAPSGFTNFNASQMASSAPTQMAPSLQFNPNLSGVNWNQQQPQVAQPQVAQPQVAQRQVAFQPQQMPQSVEQSVNQNPQSIQNFLSALGQVGAGGNNAMMHNPANQGQQAQAGFQGFQQNGQQPYQNLQQNWQGYGGQQNSQLGSQTNQSSLNNNSGGGGYNNPGVQNGGTGGNSQQPQFAQPQTALSDKTAKTSISSGESELQDFLNSLGIYSYEYKDKKHGDGRRISPMAQDIEKTPLGKVAVSTDQDGLKKVDYGKLLGTMLSGIALVNNKTNDLLDFKKQVLQDIKDKKKVK